MTHKLIKLPFKYDALEPHMDKETVEIHYSKHHQGYVNKLNETIEKYPEIQNKPIEWLLKNLSSVPEEIKQNVINNGGGVYNHNFFWSILKKNTPFDINSQIGKEILKKFTTFEKFKEKFSNKAITLFGSGWVWLALDSNELKIIQTHNQNSIISENMIPLIALDVWEHAYYLKYKNKRAEFIENFFSIINWKKVNELFLKSKKYDN
jgi:Fe-Mn family superoxide dismutase